MCRSLRRAKKRYSFVHVSHTFLHDLSTKTTTKSRLEVKNAPFLHVFSKPAMRNPESIKSAFENRPESPTPGLPSRFLKTRMPIRPCKGKDGNLRGRQLQNTIRRQL